MKPFVMVTSIQQMMCVPKHCVVLIGFLCHVILSCFQSKLLTYHTPLAQSTL